ncbi:putative nuclease HARBI1 [Sitophilus oryzae]|uniref:Putative nuclease HARBI1 n=1 Tax=Sitophilus oryzae TaxID=7048 RepID=A0A6J2YMH8_SITOR|nr:putative nuclease HARBI1 [Sitophilus oryzae]
MDKMLLLFIQDQIFNDEDDDDDQMVLLTEGLLVSKEKRLRISNYYEETIPKYMDDDFKAHFRIKRSTVEVLLCSLGPHFTRQSGRPQLPLKKQLLLSIWYLSNQEVFRSISDRFDVSKSTAYECIGRFLNAVMAIANEFIKWPSHAEAQRTSLHFREQNGFPDIIGCIDGSHVPIAKPKNKPDSYINRKGYHSIILQGICNEKYEFIDVSCGWPGSMHDARVLRKSDFGIKMTENPAALFYGNFHLLGDSAYPLNNYILTPFRDNGHLSARQKKINKKLSSIRIIIEHVYGMLKSRFRILKYVNRYLTVDIPKLTLVCCILHNVCMKQNDNVELEDNLEPTVIEEDNYYGEEQDHVREAKRNYISTIL